jgi:hypothetical protein
MGPIELMLPNRFNLGNCEAGGILRVLPTESAGTSSDCKAKSLTSPENENHTFRYDRALYEIDRSTVQATYHIMANFFRLNHKELRANSNMPLPSLWVEISL